MKPTARLLLPLAALAALAAPGLGQMAREHRPSIFLFEETNPNGTVVCTARGSEKIYVAKNDRVTWDVRNLCSGDQTVRLRFPASTPSPVDGVASTPDLEVTVRAGKQDKIQGQVVDQPSERRYKYDVVLSDGETWDPELELWP